MVEDFHDILIPDALEYYLGLNQDFDMLGMDDDEDDSDEDDDDGPPAGGKKEKKGKKDKKADDKDDDDTDAPKGEGDGQQQECK